ncbi:MAG: serine--tRNA ligase [Rhizobiales bacterium 65-9]|nr:serine--tRNA ligase [Hyphomicrobiales bacterium]OJY37647.1 MAG: serine--tRNA ligase [Rhizobiales bacterium 65-9]
MHDIRWIRDNAAAFDEALRNRQISGDDLARFSSSHLLALDDARRAAIAGAQEAQAKRNALSKEVGQAKAKKDEARAADLMAQVNAIKESLPRLEADEKKAEAELNAILETIPNAPYRAADEDGPPVGADEAGNRERLDHRFGARRIAPSARGAVEPVDGDVALNFEPKEHFELGEAMGGMDFETAAKLSGSRFVVMKQGVARLHRALGQFMLDTHTLEHGYTECNPPLLVTDDVMYGTAQLPKFSEDQFAAIDIVKFSQEISGDLKARQSFEIFALATKHSGLSDKEDHEEYNGALSEWLSALKRAGLKAPKHWLIPTAEVSLTNFVRDAIVSDDQLPMRLTALTPCFRSEAGSAGRDTRGMLRQHQFEKVELVSIVAPEKSREEHERMLWAAENVLKKLGLAFRVMTLCTGDMGFASKKTYDIEVWLPGQKAYREISSCSVCGDFQARRMKAQYRNAAGKMQGYVHTLNGSGVAVGRALIAVMETYQNGDGSVTIPDALRPYMGGVEAIGKAA